MYVLSGILCHESPGTPWRMSGILHCCYSVSHCYSVHCSWSMGMLLSWMVVRGCHPISLLSWFVRYWVSTPVSLRLEWKTERPMEGIGKNKRRRPERRRERTKITINGMNVWGKKVSVLAQVNRKNSQHGPDLRTRSGTGKRKKMRERKRNWNEALRRLHCETVTGKQNRRQRWWNDQWNGTLCEEQRNEEGFGDSRTSWFRKEERKAESSGRGIQELTTFYTERYRDTESRQKELKWKVTWSVWFTNKNAESIVRQYGEREEKKELWWGEKVKDKASLLRIRLHEQLSVDIGGYRWVSGSSWCN